MKRENLHNWQKEIDLLPHKKKIESASKKRERQKKNYTTSRQWSKQSTNLTGIKGEYAFHLCTVLPIDLSLDKRGDGGTDFSFSGITYDIKSTTYDGENPALLEMSGKRMVANVYVLVQISGWSARIIGWASKKQMRNAEIVDFGHGERRCIKKSSMSETGQDTIPPYVPSTSTEHHIAEQRSALQLLKKESLLTLPRSSYSAEGKPPCNRHGPFERRVSKTSQWDAIYCKSCGRFYGYSREPQLIEDE